MYVVRHPENQADMQVSPKAQGPPQAGSSRQNQAKARQSFFRLGFSVAGRHNRHTVFHTRHNRSGIPYRLMLPLPYLDVDVPDTYIVHIRRQFSPWSHVIKHPLISPTSVASTDGGCDGACSHFGTNPNVGGGWWVVGGGWWVVGGGWWVACLPVLP